MQSNGGPARRSCRILAAVIGLIGASASMAGVRIGDGSATFFVSDRNLPPTNRAILEGARWWLSRGSRYDASYHRIAYPGGDVPIDRGACTDLIVRALRHAGLDLQVLIHEDRASRPAAYGTHLAPDPSLDHRRTAHQVAWLRAHARSLTVGTEPDQLPLWLPGDLVYYGRRRPWHAGVVSDRTDPFGIPYILDSHQDAGGVSESHLLTRWGAIHAHFRLDGPGATMPPESR